MTTTTTPRESFVARFGEDQAEAIETAAQHAYFDENTLLGSIGRIGPHVNDHYGTDGFRYWFLYAVARGITTDAAQRAGHGITADVDEMKAWARGEGDLAGHDGDTPSYLAFMYGVYADWLPPGAGRPGRPVVLR